MSADYFITFVVPVFKIEYGQLEKCLRSLVGQREYKKPYEIILIDDGSPDQCPHICDEYGKNYENIRVIHQENSGVSVARNNGMKQAQGEWISFVDADDWIECNFVSNAEKTVNEIPCDTDIVIWDGYAEYKEKKEPIRFLGKVEERTCLFRGDGKKKLIDEILPRYLGPEVIRKATEIGVPWSKLYRKKFLLDTKLEYIPELRVMQDSVFSLWAFEYARTICYQYNLAYHYSMYDESTSKKFDSNITYKMRLVLKHLTDYICKCHNDEGYWQRLYVRTIRLLIKCLSKDYANPSNSETLKSRVKRLKIDLQEEEFQRAISKCDAKGQDIRFRIMLFMLRHRLYSPAIIISYSFSKWRHYIRKAS